MSKYKKPSETVTVPPSWITIYCNGTPPSRHPKFELQTFAQVANVDGGSAAGWMPVARLIKRDGSILVDRGLLVDEYDLVDETGTVVSERLVMKDSERRSRRHREWIQARREAEQRDDVHAVLTVECSLCNQSVRIQALNLRVILDRVNADFVPSAGPFVPIAALRQESD